MIERDVIVVRPADRRRYQLEAMRSRFLADDDETGDRYCVSEWWLDAGRTGTGPHSREANERARRHDDVPGRADVVARRRARSCASPPVSSTTSGTAATPGPGR
jgi:hypothetical protein